VFGRQRKLVAGYHFNVDKIHLIISVIRIILITIYITASSPTAKTRRTTMFITIDNQHTRPATFPVGTDHGRVVFTSRAMENKEFSLAELPIGVPAIISSINKSIGDAALSLVQRLVEIGFIPGESVRVIAHGQPGNEPIAVRIGGTTFALRRFEADCILVKVANKK
jgi:ferrous iron transport protein A